MILKLFAFFVFSILTNGAEVPDCKAFDSKKIKLVTFDVFSALMDLTSSLVENISSILPFVSRDTAQNIALNWEYCYGDYAGTKFDQSITGDSPFQWTQRQCLTKVEKQFELNLTSDDYEKLLGSWGHLQPWPNVSDTLQILTKANITVATLSNGDFTTLKDDVSVFYPEVKFAYLFGSDFPVGSFKPDTAMYQQVLDIVSYETVLHVAGASVDGGGSRAAGMFSALVNNVPDPTRPAPCFLLKDMSYLPAILGL